MIRPERCCGKVKNNYIKEAEEPSGSPKPKNEYDLNTLCTLSLIHPDIVCIYNTQIYRHTDVHYIHYIHYIHYSHCIHCIHCIHCHASMHPCIYAFMHVCTYALMHLCIYALMHLCIYAFMHLCIHPSIHPSVRPSIITRKLTISIMKGYDG
jgi:hypothetical protein